MAAPAVEIQDVSAWLDAVVLVRQGSSTCAGARIGQGRVLTAYHCVASGGRPLVEDRGGARAPARVRWVDRAGDLAVLEAPGDGPWLELADAPPALGEVVWALGHPGGAALPGGFYAGTLRWSASVGVVSAVGDRALQVTAPLNPGSSGGPIVDERGRVVAVASRRLTGQALGFAGRADGLPLDEGRGLSPLGGTWGGELFVASQDSNEGGTLAVGARLEVAVRDRLVVAGAVLQPLSGDLAAARFGSVVSAVAEATGGLRQRVGRGPWALRLDATAGVVAVSTVLRPDPLDPLDLERSVAPAPLVAGAARIRSLGFELAWLPDQDLVRSSAILRWPGTVGVF